MSQTDWLANSSSDSGRKSISAKPQGQDAVGFFISPHSPMFWLRSLLIFVVGFFWAYRRLSKKNIEAVRGATPRTPYQLKRPVTRRATAPFRGLLAPRLMWVFRL